MPFKREHFRANFVSNLDTAQINAFVDGFYTDCAKSGVEGLIIEVEGGGIFIIEGDAPRVDDLIGQLDNASELEDKDNYLTETSGGPFFTCLASHVDGDARDSTC